MMRGPKQPNSEYDSVQGFRSKYRTRKLLDNFLKTTSLTLFIAILVGFAFPFATAVYPNRAATPMSGFEIIQLGNKAVTEEQQDLSQAVPSTPQTTNENLVTLSVVSASIGIATCNLSSPQSAIITAIASGLGSGALWMFKERNQQIVLRGEEGLERIDFGYGFLASFGSFIAAFVTSLLRVFSKLTFK